VALQRGTRLSSPAAATAGRSVLPLWLALLGLLGGCSVAAGHPTRGSSPVSTSEAAADAPTASAPAVVAPTAPEPSAPRRTPAVTFPVIGSGQWTVAGESGTVVGRSGQLMRFRVAVEADIAGVEPEAFAAHVDWVLADPQGWTAGGRWRFQRVGPGQASDFTVYLATPATRDQLCGGGYDQYTSCRNGERVVINVPRWVSGAPTFGDDLDNYRKYVLNHEIGHRLGHGHELCPGAGRPAPLMQQQTLGLHGCTPNPWPFVDGRAYHGASGAYNDPIPRS
jgi:Protein of unknown function (DUF3152)